MSEWSRPAAPPLPSTSGPFRSDQVHEGDPYELSNGHPIRCMGAGERHGTANARGVAALIFDPGVKGQAGVDTGFSFNDGKNLRAPDIAVGNLRDEPGWAQGVPPLAVEYADRGQDEVDLQIKIGELLAAGTLYIWVVRLTGPLRVEVYEPKKKMRVVDGDGMLTAPGVLANSYPVKALVNELAARQVSLHNLLQQEGYGSLDEVRAQARRQGEQRMAAQSVLMLLDARSIAADEPSRRRILDCDDIPTLQRWLVRAATITALGDLFAG